MNEVPDILAACPQIDLDIARALTRSVIGVASATSCLVDRKSLFQQFSVVGAGRSEEHTYELQSLMRISYAVFCLTKKITTKQLHIRSTVRIQHIYIPVNIDYTRKT